jgi:hypothetical protein
MPAQEEQGKDGCGRGLGGRKVHEDGPSKAHNQDPEFKYQ